jgi:hypothetical protein
MMTIHRIAMCVRKNMSGENMSVATPEFISIKSKFPSKCLVCNSSISEGTQILWAKGTGVKHIVCPTKSETEIFQPPVGAKHDWKDDREYSFIEVRQVTSCQLCDADLKTGGGSYIMGFEMGFRRFCNSCFKKI